MKKLDIDLKRMIKENEFNIKYLEDYNNSRDLMIWEAKGDFTSDATIIFDYEYFVERLNDEIKSIDKKIACNESNITLLKNDIAFLKALLKS
ncbi:hypothetical protein [Oceanobacillus oncorhynchi]|uniref:hypothetical protein n=1 Tax=Oceanobacillus oncorhynchi TaxID=545501 RepID=UPI001865E042|nr:hypothetical protein [Oceanobacillus oncorhynchi]